jgi:putative SOS response-associated peptidase YedK
MCGRIGIASRGDVNALLPAEVFSPDTIDDLPRYNLGPKADVPVICRREGRTWLQRMNWWLVPHWSKDGRMSATTFNARSETVASSKVFAPYFRGARCIVPASFFFEWKKEEKRPFLFRRADGDPLALAGLFSIWRDAEGGEHPTFAVLTTEANSVMEPVHGRMPVILERAMMDVWLDREVKDTDFLQTLLEPAGEGVLESFEVSKYVNSIRNDGPECIEPLPETM